jgi:putative ABC transport system substrate-binding protein
VRRREFIALNAGAACWPFAARAQQSAMPVIGFLHSGSPDQNVGRLAAYRQGLSEAGFVEGRNIAIEFRWSEGRNDALAALAAGLVELKVAVIVAVASTAAALAAKTATMTIPIVFGVGADPVELGLVPSLSRPAGNVTGVTSLNTDLAAKRLAIFRELVPGSAHYLAMVNPTSPLTQPFVRDLQAGAAKLGLSMEILPASTDREIETAFDERARSGGALMVAPDSFFYIRRAQIVALALHGAVPTIFDVPEYVEAGGLISYGSDYLDVLRLAGIYTGRIVKGEKPADLPVVQSSKFAMTINLKTAKALGLAVPPILLAQADKVIE